MHYPADIVAGATLDLSDHSMIVRSGSLAAIQAAIGVGFDHGDGLGTGGITSSAAAADPNGRTALGYASNADLGFTSFAGITGLTASDLIIKYTYYGDADLDGQATLDDFGQFLSGYQTKSAATNNWLNGDFDYDGAVTLDDFSQFLFGYQKQGTCSNLFNHG
jgi:hypothetical protein